jgi:hypothetical protein
MNTSWKSTIGGAFSATGTAMIGIGVVPQLTGAPSRLLSVVAIAGFFFTMIGTFLGHLFAADATAVKAVTDSLQSQVTANSASIISGSPAATIAVAKPPTQVAVAVPPPPPRS